MKRTPVRVEVDVRTEQDGVVERQRHSFCGMLAETAGKRHLIYEEPLPEGGGSVKNHLIAAETILEVRRSGALKSELRFIPQEETSACLENAYGRLNFSVYTWELLLSDREHSLSDAELLLPAAEQPLPDAEQPRSQIWEVHYDLLLSEERVSSHFLRWEFSESRSHTS